MLSIELIRRDPGSVRAAMARRHEDAPIDRLLEADAERRALMTEGETLRAERNETSKKLSRMNPKPPELIAEMRGVGERIKDLEAKSGALRDEIDHILARLPNIAAANVPDGEDETGNVVLREDSDLPTFDFEPRPHWEIGEALGILDFERGQRISGSRFYTLAGAGAKLQRALIQWMLDRHIDRHGYTEVYLPYMVREQTIFGAGQLPKFRDNLYHDAEEDYWMVPTAEVPITGLYSGEILPPGALPLKHVAYTACFRREKMSAGKDIRGLKRGPPVRQGRDVPDRRARGLGRSAPRSGCARPGHRRHALGLPHRLLQLCAGDLGFAAAESYDIEVWAAGCREWLEVSSCSNCADFQARRANIRYRTEQSARPAFPHTLNGSGLALPRIMIAILENNQQADGSVVVPEALHPYTGFERIAAG